VHLGLAALARRRELDDLDEPLGQLERRLDRVGETPAVLGAHDEAVDDNGDAVVLPPVERGRVGELHQLAVDHGTDEALLARALEQLAELALPPLHERGADLEPRALGPREHHLGDLLGALPLHRPRAARAVRRTGAREEQAQVVVDLGDGADGGARVVARVLLLDRDRRRQPLDEVHVGLLHQPEELARVRRQRLDVAALPLGVDRVERERRLPGADSP
jgi:hypothetical protein